MKKLKALFAFFAIAGLAITGCSSDDDAAVPPGPVPAGAGELVATVDGVAFRSISAGTSANITDNSGTEFLQIVAVNLGGEAFTITVIRPMIEEDAYDFDSNLNITATVSYTKVDTSTFQSESFVAPYMDSGDVGTITITELTADNIKGTFNASMRNQDSDQIVEITAGSFDLPVTRR